MSEPEPRPLVDGSSQPDAQTRDSILEHLTHAAAALRGPLTSTIGVAQFALRARSATALSADGVDALTIIRREARRLAGMVELVVALSRLARGESLQDQTLDVARLVEAEMFEFGARVPRTMPSPDAPCWTSCDAQALLGVVRVLASSLAIDDRGEAQSRIALYAGPAEHRLEVHGVQVDVADAAALGPSWTRHEAADPREERSDGELIQRGGDVLLALRSAQIVARALGGDLWLEASPSLGGVAAVLTVPAAASPHVPSSE